MFEVEVKVSLYELNELSDDAKQMAIDEHRAFLLSICTEEDVKFYGTWDDVEWYIDDEYTAEDIECNGYLFYSTGELARTIEYCGAHPRAGEHVFTFDGKEYLIRKR